MELNIVSFLDGVATVIAIGTKVHQCNRCGECVKQTELDVVLKASNNDVKVVETRTVHFA